jgi:hypothetical protein
MLDLTKQQLFQTLGLIYSLEILFILLWLIKDANGGPGYIGIMDQFNVIPRNIRSRVLRDISQSG